MTSPKYTVKMANGDGDSRARKEAAVKIGEESGMSFQVFSPSGKVVHEVTAPKPDDTPTTSGSTSESEPGPTAEEAEVPAPGQKFDVAALKVKIAKMLSKAERTDNPAERDAYSAKAEAMMMRLGIQAAELEAAGEVKPEDIVEVRKPYTGIYAATWSVFSNSVARGFGNLSILAARSGQRERVVYVIGHKTDVEQFNRLLDSLVLQATSALKKFQKTEDRPTSVQDRFVVDRSFLEGFAREVSHRLAAERVTAEEEASSGAALVLASKMDRVTNWVDKNYNPKTTKGRARRSSYRATVAGQSAGRTADLGNKRVGGGKGELK